MALLHPGQLAHIGVSDRLSIPVEVLRAVEWWEDQSVEVLAELVQEGLIRIYLAREATPLVRISRERTYRVAP